MKTGITDYLLVINAVYAFILPNILIFPNVTTL